MTNRDDSDEVGGEGGELPSAWRITFEYDRGRVRIAAMQRVAMLAPPDDSALLAGDSAGYSVELRTSDRETIYRQVIDTPLQHEYEVFSPEPGEGIRRVAADEPRGVFQAVVPDLPDAAEVVLRGRPAPEEIARRTPKQLVTARLRERPYSDDWGAG